MNNTKIKSPLPKHTLKDCDICNHIDSLIASLKKEQELEGRNQEENRVQNNAYYDDNNI